MGLITTEELGDVIDVRQTQDGSYAMDSGSVNQDTGEITQAAPAAPTLPEYTDEQFSKSLPGWRTLIEAGRKTADEIILMVASKAQLNEDQVAMLRATATHETQGA